MKFDHRTKVNGVWYNAGVEVNASTPVVSTPKTENVVENATPSYKRSDIQKMKLDDLKSIASKLEIAFDDETSGNQLKKEIFIKLGI